MDYQNGKIYRIVCSESGKQYIGSTCSTLTKRLHQHKKRNALGIGCSCKDFVDPQIFLVEDYPCERKEQLLMRERFWMENTDCVNIKRPIVTKEEKVLLDKLYSIKNYKLNKDKILKKQRERYCEHKDTILAFKNRKLMCECGTVLMYQNLSRHRRSHKHNSIMNGTN